MNLGVTMVFAIVAVILALSLKSKIRVQHIIQCAGVPCAVIYLRVADACDAFRY